MSSGSTQQPAPPDHPPGEGPGATENRKRGNVVATLGTIKDLLTNVVGIVTVIVSAAALFGGGAAVGHSTASSDPGPATTVYRTVPPTATPTPTAIVEPTTTPPVQPTTPAAVGGTELNSYTVQIGFGHSIPLGATKPRQSDFSTTGLGDLGTAAPADHLVFVPINGDRMVSLDDGATPSYAGCAADTVFATQADSKPGTAFCLIESGMMAGVKITSAHPAYVVLSVTVWSYSG
ncbi:hypothetical protein V2S66_20055 [Streptomyces sp. V4-01]|uniref:Uncharacterized protein n=1 Tax=Actinacidiphila polyblastidii TaxID=3110430 RepID=A0ABU7PEN0_9ACTN|nr:hypothetical protein [Streptomyces sp. V4-01]